MAPKKRRKNKPRMVRTIVKASESPAEQREKFPKGLVDAYLNLHKTKIMVNEFGITCMAWTDEAYALYAKQVKAYLKDDAADPIISGRLVVLLHGATVDKREKIR